MNEDDDIRGSLEACLEVIARLNAHQHVLQARADAVDGILAWSLASMGLQPQTHVSWADDLRQATVDLLELRLAQMSDVDPALAGQMKAFVGEIFPVGDSLSDPEGGAGSASGDLYSLS